MTTPERFPTADLAAVAPSFIVFSSAVIVDEIGKTKQDLVARGQI